MKTFLFVIYIIIDSLLGIKYCFKDFLLQWSRRFFTSDRSEENKLNTYLEQNFYILFLNVIFNINKNDPSKDRSLHIHFHDFLDNKISSLDFLGLGLGVSAGYPIATAEIKFR